MNALAHLREAQKQIENELDREDKTLEDLALLMVHNSIDSAIELLKEYRD